MATRNQNDRIAKLEWILKIISSRLLILKKTSSERGTHFPKDTQLVGGQPESRTRSTDS